MSRAPASASTSLSSSSVHVRVLFFAKARELAGVKEAELVLPATLTFYELKDRLVKQFDLQIISEAVALAHNENFVHEAAQLLELAEADEIAVIPPLSGGEANMEGEKDFVGLQPTKLNFNDIVETVISPSCGAVSTFIGTTRNNFEQKKVLKLVYEAYEPMAVKEMKKICDQIRSQWSVEKIAIYHRLGEVPVTEASIVIAISSPHRQESLQAVQFAIDTVKSAVPIWKKEVYENDEAQWKENKECLWAKSDAHEKQEEKPKVKEESQSECTSVYKNMNINDMCDTVETKSESLDYSSDGSFADSERSTTNSVDYNMCQIKRNVNEMFSRIETFCLNKKQRASMIKLQENCIYSGTSQDDDNDDDGTSVCSRVNVIWTKHRSSKNRGEVTRVYNQWSHQNAKPSTSTKAKNESSDYPPALEERLSTTEKILGMNRPVPSDVYQRIKKIEDRMLLLESISPEYKNLWSSVMKEKNENSNNKPDDDDSSTDQNRKRSHSSAGSDSKSHELENRYGKRFR